MSDERLNQLHDLVAKSRLIEEDKQSILKNIEDLRRPLDSDVWIYRLVVLFLGLAIVFPFFLAFVAISLESLKLILPISTGAIG